MPNIPSTVAESGALAEDWTYLASYRPHSNPVIHNIWPRIKNNEIENVSVEQHYQLFQHLFSLC